MEKQFTITATTLEELKAIIHLFFILFLKNQVKECRGITAYKEIPGKGLFLYSDVSPVKDVHNLPMLLSEETLSLFLWDYLAKFEKSDHFSGDGSTGRGFSIVAKQFFNEAGIPGTPVACVNFETMYYGK